MGNQKLHSKEVEAALLDMLQNGADKYGVDRQRYFDAVRPLIRNHRLVDKRRVAKVHGKHKTSRELHMDPPQVPFEEIFSLLPGDQAIKLLEQRPPDELAKRIAFAHELADRHGCFYDLGDWQVALSGFKEHIAVLADPLLETGYPGRLFEISPWLDRVFGCLYPVKYRYDLAESPWRTKTGFSRFGTGSACAYRDADYLEFLGAEDAALLDTTQIRNEILTFRGEALDQIVLHLRQRHSGKMPLERALEIATNCLDRGQNYISRETIEFLRRQDELFDYGSEMLPFYCDTKLHVRAGGLRDLARVIEQVTMELTIRPRSDIRARLSLFKAEAPRVGLAFDLRFFYQDYAQHKGHDLDRMYQAWEASKPEQEAYSKQFWQEVERVFDLYNTEEGTCKSSRNVRFGLRDNGRTIVSKKGDFSFTKYQASIIAIFWKNFLDGNEYMIEQDVMMLADKSVSSSQDKTQARYSQTNFKSVFRSRQKEFQELFERHPKYTDQWRLRGEYFDCN